VFTTNAYQEGGACLPGFLVSVNYLALRVSVCSALIAPCDAICAANTTSHLLVFVLNSLILLSPNRYKAHSLDRCTLVFVFDGRRCPYKKRNEQSKRRRQQVIRERDEDRTYEGIERALKLLMCIDGDVLYWVKQWVSARQLNGKVFFFGVPYETDAQLVQLERQGIVDGIITDDGEWVRTGACECGGIYVSHLLCVCS